MGEFMSEYNFENSKPQIKSELKPNINPDLKKSFEANIKTRFKTHFSDILNKNLLQNAILLEGTDKETRDMAAKFFSAYAVCKSEQKPCLDCNPCKKVINDIHPDIIKINPSGAANIVKLKDLREALKKADIAPNEADKKVFVILDADKTLREDSQNTLLKTVEEPTSDVLFIFTAENSLALLPTILSRLQVINLNASIDFDSETSLLAQKIADAIISINEYELLLELNKIKNNAQLTEVLKFIEEYLRLALLSSGKQKSSSSFTAQKLSKKLTKERILSLLDVTRQAKLDSKTNIDTKLLCTFICTKYRRISWQK